MRAVDDCEEHRPETIRCGVDGLLVAELVEVVGLARLEQGDIRIAGTMQGDIVMIGDMAEELPFLPGQSELNGRTPPEAKRCLEQLIKGMSTFIDVHTWTCQPIIG